MIRLRIRMMGVRCTRLPRLGFRTRGWSGRRFEWRELARRRWELRGGERGLRGRWLTSGTYLVIFCSCKELSYSTCTPQRHCSQLVAYSRIAFKTRSSASDASLALISLAMYHDDAAMDISHEDDSIWADDAPVHDASAADSGAQVAQQEWEKLHLRYSDVSCQSLHLQPTRD